MISPNHPAEQLELFAEGPFTLRLTIQDGLRIFWDNYWKDKPKAKATKRFFRLIPEFCSTRKISYVDQITKHDVEELRKWLGAMGLKPNSVNTYHGVLTRWIAKLMDFKKAKTVNGHDLSRIQLPAANPGGEVPKIDESQFNRNVAWTKAVTFKLVYAAIMMNDQFMADTIEAMYITGLRPGDVWRLTEKNVDFVHKVLSGIQNKSINIHTPSGLPIYMAITPRLETILRRRVAEVKAGACLFRDETISYEAWLQRIGRRFAAVRKAAGLAHVQLRDFRPSSTSLLLDNNVDPETIRQIRGWTTLRMLPVYARRSMAHQRQAQEKVEDPKTEILT